MQDCQVEEQVIVEHTQTINEAKPLKILEVPTIEDPAGEGTEIENVSKENTEVSSQIVSSEAPDFSRLVKRDLLKRINGKSLEEDHPGVLETKGKRKKKRVLLTAWSTMNNDQYAITSHNNFTEGNELQDYEGDSIMMEQPSDPIHSLIQPLHEPYPNEDFVTLEEKPESAETTICQLPVIRINPKAEKEMLEKQYYALMKQAETNCFHMAGRQINLSEEEQYHALMKHAAKMYQEFKD